jgi:hypothetical protein
MSAMVESGASAPRCGGLAPPTNSWLMPGNEMPIIPTLLFSTHDCAATVSTTS